MGNAWDFGPGNFDDPGVDYGWESMIDSPAASWSAGWQSTLQGIANTAVNTWSAKTLMQQNQQGQRYIEGQRVTYSGAQGGMSGLLLLAGAGLLIFALAK